MTKTTKTTAAATILLLFAGPVLANDGAIEHRKAIYQAIGGHMKGMVAVLKGQVPHTENLGPHAKAIAALSQMVENVFPPDSDFGETRAKMDIWKNQADFKEKISAFQKAAADLAATDPSDMKAFGSAVGALGKTCKSCHDKYREEK